MSDVAEARSRIAAFGWDYLLIFGYLILLVGVGLSGGPPGWSVVLLATYLVGLTRFGGHRPLCDRLAGTVVVRS